MNSRSWRSVTFKARRDSSLLFSILMVLGKRKSIEFPSLSNNHLSSKTHVPSNVPTQQQERSCWAEGSTRKIIIFLTEPKGQKTLVHTTRRLLQQRSAAHQAPLSQCVSTVVEILFLKLWTLWLTCIFQCLKITQNVAFEFFQLWHFPPIFVL